MSARPRPSRSRSASSFSLTATLFVPVQIDHPLWMIAFLVLTSIAFSLFGFIIGIWAKTFEQLAIIPALVVTPLTFLGGAFYSIDMLPPFWRTVSLFNPVVYLVSGFRWSFYGQGDVSVAASLGFTRLFIAACLAVLVVDLPHRLAAEAVRRMLISPDGLDEDAARSRYSPRRAAAAHSNAASLSTPANSRIGTGDASKLLILRHVHAVGVGDDRELDERSCGRARRWRGRARVRRNSRRSPDR